MKENHSASIVSIGTEVTSGQILNSNAKTLAERLESIGYNVIRHVAVPDENELIIEGLRYGAQGVSVMILTGGLGPTLDDITRDAVAEWLRVPLQFDNSSWDRIVKIFEERGRTPAEGQRRQAMFPRGAQPLLNRAGTANGFFISRENIESHGRDAGTDESGAGADGGDGGNHKTLPDIYVLPGPPKEIDSIWSDHIETALRKNLPVKPTLLCQYRCQGLGESQFAAIAEEALCVEISQLKIGYRLDYPFVEIKIWIDSSRLDDARPWLEKLRIALGDYLKEVIGPQ